MDALPPDLDPGKTLEFLEELIEGCRLDAAFATLIPPLEEARKQLERQRIKRLRLERQRRFARPRVERMEYELRRAARAVSSSVQSTDPSRLAGVRMALFPDGFTDEIVRTSGSTLLARGTSVLELLLKGVPFLCPLPASQVEQLRDRVRDLRAALASRDSVAGALVTAMEDERSAADTAARRVQHARDEMRKESKGDLERARAAYPRSPRGGKSASVTRERA